VEGSCEHANESSGPIKCWEILEQLRDWQLLRMTLLHGVSSVLSNNQKKVAVL
jgi:hypothetical protein